MVVCNLYTCKHEVCVCVCASRPGPCSMRVQVWRSGRGISRACFARYVARHPFLRLSRVPGKAGPSPVLLPLTSASHPSIYLLTHPSTGAFGFLPEHRYIHPPTRLLTVLPAPFAQASFTTQPQSPTHLPIHPLSTHSPPTYRFTTHPSTPPPSLPPIPSPVYPLIRPPIHPFHSPHSLRVLLCPPPSPPFFFTPV